MCLVTRIRQMMWRDSYFNAYKQQPNHSSKIKHKLKIISKISINLKSLVNEMKKSLLEASLTSGRPLISAFISSSFRQFCSTADSCESYLTRFRKNRALTVTDIVNTEWCEQKKVSELLEGKPAITKAMSTGSARHAQLEKESNAKILATLANRPLISPCFSSSASSLRQFCSTATNITSMIMECIKMPEISTRSREGLWASMLIKFIIRANQLLEDGGLIRELPVVANIDGIWISGRIDEIQKDKKTNNIILIDIKTRGKSTLPREAQKRNGRFQAMCYKALYENLINNQFPIEDFFRHFNLDPDYVLSDKIQGLIYPFLNKPKLLTLRDLVSCYANTCSMLPPSSNELLLRYEFQKDNSLLEEYRFDYDKIWFEGRLRQLSDVWTGRREPSCVSEDEKWKCNSCKFKDECPSQLKNN